jgi:hypothetical protein
VAWSFGVSDTRFAVSPTRGLDLDGLWAEADRIESQEPADPP